MRSVPEEAPQEIVDLMERCMQVDPADRPKACECIEVVSKYLRLPQNGSGKYRDAPMRTSSNESPMGRRRSSNASTAETRSPPPKSFSSEHRHPQSCRLSSSPSGH